MLDDLDRISFAEWLILLNLCADKTGYKTEQPLTQITGQLDWLPSYEERLSPDSALEQAAKDGLKFGKDY